MKKRNIVRKSDDFTRIIKNNNIFKNNCFYIFMQKNNIESYQVGITVPTKMGNAVVRNKIKRRIKNIIDSNNELLLNGYQYIILVRKEFLNNDFATLNKNMVFCLSKIKERNK